MGRPRGAGLNEKQIIEALKRSGGFISQAAKSLGVTQGAISTRIKKSKKLQDVLTDIKEERLDFAESKLIKKMDSDDLGAICFYLKCQGKHRGYVEKAEIEHSQPKNTAWRIERVIVKSRNGSD